MDGLNWYVYVNSSPLRYVDQDGQVPLDTIVDVVWLLWDIDRVACGDKNALSDIAIDVAGLAIPYVPAAALKGAKAAAKGTSKVGDVAVYVSRTAEGAVQYVGITNDFARRAAEHLTSKEIRIQPLMQGLSRTDARAVDQALIEIHGLSKNVGILLNKINSIAKTNKSYAGQLSRGYELLKNGYNVVRLL